jgi:D-amino-acid dehydrogenase
MRIAVIGAGIVGVTTAHELAAEGHEVVVHDQRGSVAAAGSFAVGGVQCPSLTGPLAGPGLRAALLRGWAAGGSPLRWHPLAGGGTWGWVRRAWGAATPGTWSRTQAAFASLARASLDRQVRLCADLLLEIERSDGLLMLWRDAKALARARADAAWIEAMGTQVHWLDESQARAHEDALNADTPIAGALRLNNGGVGNCRQFAHLLRDHGEQRLSIDYRFSSQVTALTAEGDGLILQAEQLPLTTGFAAPAGPPTGPDSSRQALSRRAHAAARFLAPVTQERFDHVVMCTGAEGAGLLQATGVRLPMMPVHAHSVTFPLRAPELGPRSAVLDAARGITVARLGQRVRVAGGAELGGVVSRPDEGSVKALYQALHDWFPAAAHLARPQVWKGAQAVLADGPPLIGPSGVPGLWLNLGHGQWGWTLACGSARLLADLVAGRSAALDTAPFLPTSRLR